MVGHRRMKLSCEMCGAQPTNVICQYHAKSWMGLKGYSGRSRTLCAEHLTLAFGEAFRAYRHKVIVFPPLFEKCYLSGGYDFTPANELSPPERRSVEATFDLVTGPCSACGLSASSVAYAGDDYVERWTMVERLDQGKVPTSLCKGCAFDRLAPSLVQNCLLFQEGINLPYGGDGVLCPEYY